MTYLPDVNVWVALAIPNHTHNKAALEWLDELDKSANFAFCRVTQQGFLRLLTNEKALGQDAKRPEEAWEHYESWSDALDARLAPEPQDLEEGWRAATKKGKPGRDFWTDTYLAAFAKVADYTIVSFDQGFQRYDVELRLLT